MDWLMHCIRSSIRVWCPLVSPTGARRINHLAKPSSVDHQPIKMERSRVQLSPTLASRGIIPAEANACWMHRGLYFFQDRVSARIATNNFGKLQISPRFDKAKKSHFDMDWLVAQDQSLH